MIRRKFHPMRFLVLLIPFALYGLGELYKLVFNESVVAFRYVPVWIDNILGILMWLSTILLILSFTGLILFGIYFLFNWIFTSQDNK